MANAHGVCDKFSTEYRTINDSLKRSNDYWSFNALVYQRKTKSIIEFGSVVKKKLTNLRDEKEQNNIGSKVYINALATTIFTLYDKKEFTIYTSVNVPFNLLNGWKS